MVVGYGRSWPKGSLPVFKVPTEEDARRLIVFACQTNKDGEHVAEELVLEQNLDNLELFSKRLEKCWEMIK